MIKKYVLSVLAVGAVFMGTVSMGVAFVGMSAALAPAYAADPATTTATAVPASTPAGSNNFVSNIAVLDLEAVVQNSEAGKGVSAAIAQREKALQAQANDMKKSLKTKEQKLIADRKANIDQKTFEDEKKKFEDELKSSQQSLLSKSNELEKSKLAALKTIQQHIAKITADVADERKIQIVVDRKFVVIAEQNMDITDEVLKRLNQDVKSIPFN